MKNDEHDLSVSRIRTWTPPLERGVTEGRLFLVWKLTDEAVERYRASWVMIARISRRLSDAWEFRQGNGHGGGLVQAVMSGGLMWLRAGLFGDECWTDLSRVNLCGSCVHGHFAGFRFCFCYLLLWLKGVVFAEEWGSDSDWRFQTSSCRIFNCCGEACLGLSSWDPRVEEEDRITFGCYWLFLR